MPGRWRYPYTRRGNENNEKQQDNSSRMPAQAKHAQGSLFWFFAAKYPPGQFSIKLYNIYEKVLHLVALFKQMKTCSVGLVYSKKVEKIRIISASAIDSLFTSCLANIEYLVSRNFTK
jgi:hypothetical protein